MEETFESTTPNQVWLKDITYSATEEGWLYLAGHMDLFTRKIVGYAMGERMTKILVMQSLQRAMAVKRPTGADPSFGSE